MNSTTIRNIMVATLSIQAAAQKADAFQNMSEEITTAIKVCLENGYDQTRCSNLIADTLKASWGISTLHKLSFGRQQVYNCCRSKVTYYYVTIPKKEAEVAAKAAAQAQAPQNASCTTPVIPESPAPILPPTVPTVNLDNLRSLVLEAAQNNQEWAKSLACDILDLLA